MDWVSLGSFDDTCMINIIITLESLWEATNNKYWRGYEAHPMRIIHLIRGKVSSVNQAFQVQSNTYSFNRPPKPLQGVAALLGTLMIGISFWCMSTKEGLIGSLRFLVFNRGTVC